jgi:hypothetical protein
MRRFKLIKEYPGSPEWGMVRSDENKLGKWRGYNYYEKYPEYWEEILEVNFMVSLTDMPFHNAWEPIKVDTIKLDTDTKKYFSTKEGARDFIIQYKPCLSLNEVREEITTDNYKDRMLKNLSELVKSRI